MAQYSAGTVAVTQNNAVVTGTGTSWLSSISVGDDLIIVGDNVSYSIASIDSDTQVTLNSNYAGSTGIGLIYRIHKDYTAFSSIPYPEPNDIETHIIFKEAMKVIDESLVIDGGTF